MCKYLEPYAGRCKQPNVENKEFCEYHTTLKCSNRGCNNQAIAGCGESSSLVCGAPYCDNCGTHKDCWYKRKP